jgi:hypothetical protein
MSRDRRIVAESETKPLLKTLHVPLAMVFNNSPQELQLLTWDAANNFHLPLLQLLTCNAANNFHLPLLQLLSWDAANNFHLPLLQLLTWDAANNFHLPLL